MQCEHIAASRSRRSERGGRRSFRNETKANSSALSQPRALLNTKTSCQEPIASAGRVLSRRVSRTTTSATRGRVRGRRLRKNFTAAAVKCSGFSGRFGLRGLLRQKPASPGENVATASSPPAERLASELQTLESNYVKPETGVLILDQFEEWFIEYPSEEQRRAATGRFLRGLVDRRFLPVARGLRVRREFLIDLQDMADELPDPLSSANLFHVKNFSVEQTIDVIGACASADGLVPDGEFAETLARDLAEGGQVRPPELQIVCTYLATSGGLTTPNYRAKGGTAGILAHYIQEALSSSRDPELRSRVLRRGAVRFSGTSETETPDARGLGRQREYAHSGRGQQAERCRRRRR